MNRHQPYHPMNPRLGISPAHATAPGYGYASLDGEGGPTPLYIHSTLYIAPKGYTKHYYAESERVASKLGNGGLLKLDYPLVDESLFRVKRYANTEHAQNVVYECLHAEDARPSTPLSYL